MQSYPQACRDNKDQELLEIYMSIVYVNTSIYYKITFLYLFIMNGWFDQMYIIDRENYIYISGLKMLKKCRKNTKSIQRRVRVIINEKGGEKYKYLEILTCTYFFLS